MIDGSFWRRLPAAALRGLTNSRPPAGRGLLVHPLEAGDRAGTPRRAPRARRGRTPLRRRRRVGDGADRRHVGRDVLADPAVAPRRRLDVPAALVADAHRHAVDLQLAHVAHGLAGRPRATRCPTPPARPAVIALSRLIIGTEWTTGANERARRARRPPGRRSRRRPARGARPRARAARARAGRSRRRRSPGRRARGSAGCGRRRARSARRCAVGRVIGPIGHDFREAMRRGRTGWRRPAR